MVIILSGSTHEPQPFFGDPPPSADDGGPFIANRHVDYALHEAFVVAAKQDGVVFSQHSADPRAVNPGAPRDD